MSGWTLAGLARGDEVAYYRYGSGWSGTHVVWSTVARLTGTWVVLSDGKKFRRTNGREVGAAYGYQLTDPNGEVATAARVRDCHDGFTREVEALCKGMPPTPEEMIAMLKGVERVVGKYRDKVTGFEVSQ